jgi:hypothetical protein
MNQRGLMKTLKGIIDNAKSALVNNTRETTARRFDYVDFNKGHSLVRI